MTNVRDLRAKHEALSHAMQSGVAMMMEKEPNGETNPKHLRVGVNAAMIEHGALVKVLIDKGLITEEEYWEAAVANMKAEVASYEAKLTALFGGGTKITLG